MYSWLMYNSAYRWPGVYFIPAYSAMSRVIWLRKRLLSLELPVSTQVLDFPMPARSVPWVSLTW